MRGFVRLTLLATDEVFDLGPGDIIGRSDQAVLCAADPRVSEAHAMVSLRGRSLTLLALRGRFRVDGKVVADIVLEAGLVIELAPSCALRCDHVVLPESLPGILVPGLPALCLSGTTSLFVTDPPRLSRGYSAEADAVFWAIGPAWFMSAGQERRELVIGDDLVVAGLPVSVVSIVVGDAALPRTLQSLRVPLIFRVYGEAVRIDREGATPLQVGGVPGRILAALLRSHEAPTHWEALAAEVWQGEYATKLALRRRFDVGLTRLRSRLRPLLATGEELLVLDGSGTISLSLDSADVIKSS